MVGAAVDPGVAVGGLEIPEVDVDPAIAAEGAVVERSPEAQADEASVAPEAA